MYPVTAKQRNIFVRFVVEFNLKKDVAKNDLNS
jgi:hypothetical protein